MQATAPKVGRRNLSPEETSAVILSLLDDDRRERHERPGDRGGDSEDKQGGGHG